jgi:hypothetical protein
MSIKQPLPQRRGVHYRKIEVPVYRQIEDELCEDLGLTYSELVKFSIRKLSNDMNNKFQLRRSPEMVY